ncbi:hypothetical protein P7C71_g1761, partial [Lecanoromycetidae sp. Uapishka_2]
MAPVVEAGSLASVVDLADNPPQHLQYGDVFLTTMKPKEKSVTAQDVQSSLYYVHVHGVEDQELMNFEEPDDGQPTEHEPPLVAPLSSKSSVRRKPLPPTSNTALLNQPEPPLAPQVQSPPSTDGLQNVRKPVGRGGTAHDNLDNAPPLPDRRLHGPRPMNQNLHSVYGAALQDVSARMNVDMRRWSEQPALVAPKLPPRPDSTYTLKLPHATQNGALTTTKHKHRAEQSPSERTAEHCWDWEKRWEQKRLSGDMVRRTSSQYALFNNGGVFQNCSLTLIRRYNGEQWNAAKILTGANGAFPNDPGLSRGSSTASGVNESIENEYSGSEVQLEDRLDLSLGQEHAGGGFGGKQAKLGKLIIENEGLQMLDLIVAANMALYWKIYEKLT